MDKKMDSKENDMEAANHRLQESIEEPSKKKNVWKTQLTKPTPQNPLVPSIVFFYEEIKLIPNSTAKEPWLLKKYLNCCKFAYQRLKADPRTKFDEKRFVQSAMTRLDGEAFDYVFRMKPMTYQELELNLLKFFTNQVEILVTDECVELPIGVPPVKELMAFLEKIQEIRDTYMIMGDYCKDRVDLDNILIRRIISQFNEEPYKIARKGLNPTFRQFKDNCMEEAVKWFSLTITHK